MDPERGGAFGGKRKAVILARLKGGPRRYGAFRALIPGLSGKMLTRRLRDLQAAGLVTGQAGGSDHRTCPLTSRGDSLRPVL